MPRCELCLMMDILEIVVITLLMTNVLTKKYASSSDESIENLLYYKDCQHKAKETTENPTPLRLAATRPPRQPECPFPKMCCSLSCGDDCGRQQPFTNRQMDAVPSIQPFMPMEPPPVRQRQAPIQPQVNQRGRKKKEKFPPPMQLPLIARRDFGFTKDKIKSLISQDEDIRKILKDLVRVTMKKVDLLEMMHTASTESATNAEISNGSDEDYQE